MLPNWLILGISPFLATTRGTELQAILSEDLFPSSLYEEGELGSKRRGFPAETAIFGYFPTVFPRQGALAFDLSGVCLSNECQRQPVAGGFL